MGTILTPFMRQLVDGLEKTDLGISPASSFWHILPLSAAHDNKTDLPCRYEDVKVRVYFEAGRTGDIKTDAVPEDIKRLLTGRGYLAGAPTPLCKSDEDSPVRIEYALAVQTPAQVVAELQWLVREAKTIWRR